MDEWSKAHGSFRSDVGERQDSVVSAFLQPTIVLHMFFKALIG